MIQLYEDYYLDSDSYNFRLVKKRKPKEDKRKEENKDKDALTIIGYFQSLDNLYERLIRECEKEAIADENVKTLKDFVMSMSGVLGMMAGAIKQFESIPPVKRYGDEEK